jgi:hypothetical protein
MIRNLVARLTRRFDASRGTVNVRAIAFVGEQDGPVEQELKKHWKVTLSDIPDIVSAYLARATYGAEPVQNVVLCLYSKCGANAEIAARLQQPFIAAGFSVAEKLDIVFLSEDQNLRVRQCCAPFYVAG